MVQVIGLGLLIMSARLYESSLAYPGVMALAPVGGTLLLLATGTPGAASLPGRLLASRPLVALGGASYGWYLWHWPLMVLGAVLIPDIGVAGRLAWGFAGLLAAMVTFRVIERPVHAHVVPAVLTRRPLVVAAFVSATLILLGMAWARRSASFVRESEHRQYAAARNDHPRHDCWGGSERTVHRDACAFGATGSATTVALIGDSHASHWLPALARAGRAHGWRVEPHVMGACPVADLRGLLSGAAARLHASCGRFLEATLARLETERPRAVILSNSDFYMKAEPIRVSEAAWTEGLRRTYLRLEQAGIRTLVIRGTPWVPFDVPSCLSRRAARLPLAGDCGFAPDRPFIGRAQGTQDRASRGLNVRFIDMNDQVCAPGRCATERGGMVVYSDDNHLTANFSQTLGPVLGKRLLVALGGP
jgi:hypothetical protein